MKIMIPFIMLHLGIGVDVASWKRCGYSYCNVRFLFLPHFPRESNAKHSNSSTYFVITQNELFKIFSCWFGINN